MHAVWKRSVVLVLLLSASRFVSATDLTIHLKGSQVLSRKTVQYECDVQGQKMGLPVGAFSVEYINGDGNSLAILPIHGQSLIFSNIVSGSGARYAAGPYIWWDAAGRSISLSSDSIAGTARTECHPAELK